MKQDPPAKLYHSISEVAAITGVKAHVLRYWEAEFPSLRPGKTRSGSRRYREADIREVLAIKSLLYDEGFKIAGARKARRQARSQETPEAGTAPQMALPFDRMDSVQQMALLKEELRDLLAMVRTLGVSASAAPPAFSASLRIPSRTCASRSAVAPTRVGCWNTSSAKSSSTELWNGIGFGSGVASRLGSSAKPPRAGAMSDALAPGVRALPWRDFVDTLARVPAP